MDKQRTSMIVIKRDGTKEDFDINKIQKAVYSAFNATNRIVPNYLINMIDALFSQLDGDTIGVEEIQDKIEHILMNDKFFDVAKSYILYREKHKENRELKSRFHYMKDYIKSDTNAATSSEVDSNANVSLKNVANLKGETHKATNKKLQRIWMKDTLKKLYPELAKQYEKDLEHHIIYTHDESSFPVPTNYCEAVTLYPLLMDGTSTMDGLRTSPPKNLNSFCGQLINLCFLLAAQCKGAVALPEFFNFFDYFCVKEWGENWDKYLDSTATSSIYQKQKTIKDTIIQSFQQIVFFWNQPAGNRDFQSMFINISYFDSNYWKALFEDFCFPDGTKPKWERVDTLQRMFLKWFNDERKKTLLTFPVESMALLTDGKDVIDKEYKNLTAEMWSEGHSFFLFQSDDADSLSSCCRLRNKLAKNEFSFTNGLTSVKTGSCNVITLNLNRIIQDWSKWYYENMNGADYADLHTFYAPSSGFKSYLINILDRMYKYHIAYKTMLYELEDRGMLPASKAGYIQMRDLFSTIGLNGLNEAAEFMGIKCDDNPEYKKFVQLITGTISEQNKLNSSDKFKFNQEFVPAESLSSKNYNWDKEDGYVVNLNRVLYNSYIYLADDPNTSILDKIRLHGREYTGLMDGGVGCHLNLEEHLSKEQYLKIIDYAIEVGCQYFTFNVPNTECKDCGHIEKIPVEKCPVCGSKNIVQWTRVIGFLRPIDKFDKYRQIEAANRVYSNKNIK